MSHDRTSEDKAAREKRKAEAEDYQKRIQQTLRRVPGDYTHRDHKKTVAYKAASKQALKLSSAKTPNLEQLIQAHSAIATYYKGQ